MEKQRVIVNVRDYFEDNRTAYIVMEYIQGITFTELTRKSGGKGDGLMRRKGYLAYSGVYAEKRMPGLMRRKGCQGLHH